MITYFLMASIFMVGAGSLPLVTSASWTPLVSSGLAVAGKFAMGGLFSVIFLYTSELYPTIVRFVSERLEGILTSGVWEVVWV